jgi:hypothetical protein
MVTPYFGKWVNNSYILPKILIINILYQEIIQRGFAHFFSLHTPYECIGYHWNFLNAKFAGELMQ